MTTHALYRFFDEAGDLLYVGITVNPAARWKQHSEDKPWWTDVANITVEAHKNRKEVLEAEYLAIKTEHPRYNKVHNSPPVATVKPQRLAWKCERCGEGIADRSGSLWVSIDEANSARMCEEEWEARWADDELGWPVPNPAESFDTYPPAVTWRAMHDWCLSHEESLCHGYFIDVHRIRTHGDLLAWTAHLAGKSWLPQTNWMWLMEAIAGALPV